MPQFLTRQSFFQQQPQAAQLPFSQFGGNRGPLQGDTTGGIAFPDAGMQPEDLLAPTGLSPQELQALVGERFERSGNRRVNSILGFRNEFPEAMMGTFNASQARLSGSNTGSPRLGPGGQFVFGGAFDPLGAPAAETTFATSSAVPLGGGVDKFNPTLNTGAPFPTLSPSSPTTTTATNPLNRNLFGGF
jgi:hypothetical protein